MAGEKYFEIIDNGDVAGKLIAGTAQMFNPISWVTGKQKRDWQCMWRTVDDLEGLVNLSGDWRRGSRYIVHPILTDCYIEETEYKDYLLREMVRDISDFIMAYFPLKEITVGLVEENYSNIGLSLSVKELSTSAKLNCYVSSSYLFHLNNTQQGDMKDLKYNIWIDKFPDIISAVTHGTRSMEVIKETQVAIDASAVIATFAGDFSQNNSIKFYVKYERK